MTLNGTDSSLRLCLPPFPFAGALCFFSRAAKSVMWPDKWTAATADGRRTAQFEHTFLMTADGAVPLTAKLDDSPRQFWEK